MEETKLSACVMATPGRHRLFSRKGSLQLFADIEHCQQESGMIVYLQAMAREFKPVSFFVMIAVAAFVGRDATTFYTHRATAKEDVEK